MNSRYLAFIFGLSIFSCNYDKLTPGFEEVGICFDTEILPIFVSNCTSSGCHNSVDKEEGFDLTYYEGIMKGIKPFKPNSSKHLEYMRESGDDQMPPPPAEKISEENMKLIEEWISLGAPNTSNCEKNSCDSLSNISYSFDIAPIMETYCNGCHSGSSAGGGYDLTIYSGVKSSVNNGSLLGSVRHDSGYQSMPENGGKLSSCRIKTIEVWIAEGATNN